MIKILALLSLTGCLHLISADDDWIMYCQWKKLYCWDTTCGLQCTKDNQQFVLNITYGAAGMTTANFVLLSTASKITRQDTLNLKDLNHITLKYQHAFSTQETELVIHRGNFAFSRYGDEEYGQFCPVIAMRYRYGEHYETHRGIITCFEYKGGRNEPTLNHVIHSTREAYLGNTQGSGYYLQLRTMPHEREIMEINNA